MILSLVTKNVRAAFINPVWRNACMHQNQSATRSPHYNFFVRPPPTVSTLAPNVPKWWSMVKFWIGSNPRVHRWLDQFPRSSRVANRTKDHQVAGNYAITSPHSLFIRQLTLSFSIMIDRLVLPARTPCVWYLDSLFCCCVMFVCVFFPHCTEKQDLWNQVILHS